MNYKKTMEMRQIMKMAKDLLWEKATSEARGECVILSTSNIEFEKKFKKEYKKNR